MADNRRSWSPRPWAIVRTPEFSRWYAGLDVEGQTRVVGAMRRIAETGPTLGRPHVDTLHGTRLAKLKEARIDRGTRVLFAFDSNRAAVMLVGGDKSGRWDRWYPQRIRLAERLYADHERRLRKEPRCLTPRTAARRRTGPSR